MDRCGVFSVLLLLALATPVDVCAGQAQDLGTCEELFALHPEGEEPSKCINQLVSENPALKSEAIRRLEKHLRRHPQNPWPYFHLGNLKWRKPGALELYRTAADLFAGRGEAQAEVLARWNLHHLLLDQERLDEARLEVERTVRAAEASGEPLLEARGLILKAKHLEKLGEELGEASRLLRKAEDMVFPQADYSLQRDWLIWRGNVSVAIGRRQEAKDAYRRYLELAVEAGDHYAEASARYNLIFVLLEELADLPREGDKLQVKELARQVLDQALASGHRSVAAKAHWMLGLLASGEEARQHLEQCLAVAPQDLEKSDCLTALARHLATASPGEAQALIDRALALAHQAEDPWAIVFAWREQMRLSWSVGPLERAVADSQQALSTIEALRDLQTDSDSLAGLFSTWSDDYYWFSGRLLKAFLADQGGESLERAFAVTERLRARVLIDALEAASAAAPAPAPELQEQLAGTLEAIAKVQHQLLDPELAPHTRKEMNLRRQRLEIEEADVRNRIRRANPAFASLRRPDFATLTHVRSSLAGDEALLSFQVAPWSDLIDDFVGGSWLLAVTRNSTRVYRLPGPAELRPAVSLFNGLFGGRDGAEIVPSVALYRRLVETALDDLPAGIERLIVVPDDALHLLPFAALRAAAEAEPLALRYQLTLVPSATLWHRWRSEKPAPAEVPALVFADPPIPFGAPGDRQPAKGAERGGWTWAAPRLQPLPHARREGHAVVSHLGGKSLLLVGKEASEDFLKHADLRRFGILHFATHSLVAEESPRNSAVLLAPGAEGEEGLLQIREIVELELDGRIVVLSSCRSASGAVLRGEGVMGLARAFFQAGAHTVVASLWPLRDRDAEKLFHRFYRYLGEGRSVAAALRAAQRDRIAAGAPAAAWAGLVVLGDGELVPVPGGTPSFRPTGWRLAFVGGVIFVLLLLGSLSLRRRGSPA